VTHRAADADASEVIERLFPGCSFTIEPLSGGITNANFKVRLSEGHRTPAQDVVVRIPGKDTHFLGIDRRAEAAANVIAARVGVAPELLAVDPTTGGIVTRYIEGRPVPMEELRTEPMLRAVVSALGRVHRAGKVDTQFDHFSIIRGYHELAGRHGVTEPFDYHEAAQVLSLVESVRPFQPSVLGHNDLLNANFLYDGSVRILDWEYAGISDPFFDLANLSVNNALGHDHDELLLSHYLGSVDARALAMLRLMKLVSELREAMWGVVQMAISALDVDFSAYARERGERFFCLVDELNPGHLASLALAAPSSERRSPATCRTYRHSDFADSSHELPRRE
jgi:thiamine kinase-like enzyme